MRPLLFLGLLSACAAPGDRVVVVGMDGLDRLKLEELLAQGELPAFQRLRDEGAIADLEVDGPVLSPIVWTSIASGYEGELHGIGGWTSASGRTFSGADVRSRRVWDEASAQGVPSVVSGWLMTWPASPIPGALLSDRFVWAFPMNKDPEDPTVEMSRQSHAELPHLLQPQALLDAARSLQPTPEELAGDPAGWQLQEYGGPFHPLPRDELHLRFWAQQWDAPAWGSDRRPRLGMVHLVMADQVSHLYWPFADEGALRLMRADPGARAEAAARDRATRTGRRPAPYAEGPLGPEELADGARWVPDAYRSLDAMLARVMDQLDPEDTTLLVVSDHGFQASRSNPVLNGGHRTPAVLLAWGNRVRAGQEDTRGHVLDLAPTLAALLQLPGAADWTGRPLATILDLPARQPEPEATWLLPRVSLDLEAGPQDEAEASLLEQLEALGYVDELGKPVLGASRSQGRTPPEETH